MPTSVGPKGRNAHVCTGGEVYAARDISMEDLLRIVDMVSEIAKE